jgi:uncharacterized membrane protein
MRSVFLFAALALAGCEQTQPTQAQAAAPAATVTDFSKPMLARGNEPFWAVKIEGTTFTLSRPGEPDAVFTAPGGQISPGKGSWTAKGADGREITVTLYVSPCSDGMSSQRYPMTAEVNLGVETLGGCAAKLSDMPARPAPG